VIKRGLLSLHYGCKVNQYETNAMTQKFVENGYKVVHVEEQSDICVINTCTVTNMADKKSRQMIRHIKQLNKDAIIVATGCYAQVNRKELEELDEIDIVVSNNEKQDIVSIVESKLHFNSAKPIEEEMEFSEFGTVTYTEKTRAVIKVQDGCNNFCSYCIIPYAKGRVRSRKLENVITEIKKIVEKGIKEVVITGIHVASYGKDFDNDIRLINLLEEINQIGGLKRIRLGSLEPKIITEDFVKRLKKLDKICNHFHLSLQSGCNETLKRMNRKYTIEEFQKVTELLRENFEEVALTTDIIVGFPGETEEEFEMTYKFLEKIKFSKMHVFKYSIRQGTVAAKMPNQIDGTIKEKRSQKLIELSNKNEIEFMKNCIGKTIEVLFEEEKEDGYIEGHTTNYVVIETKGKDLENTIKKVRVEKLEGNLLKGKIM
jgi:threonylcarbamoyladenosine tRNA methylthiotransferase MtaB